MARRKQLKLSNANEVRKALARIANMVLNGEIETKQAKSIRLACNAILSGIRTDEQEKKIVELEKIVKSAIEYDYVEGFDEIGADGKNILSVSS